ncbi:hypothetical protein BOTBODRAFT_182255 [Botryobasidium botryosum FD-172 SS1]|uniref:Uncharacterized protein n=1 Tax=Botryobasidium botryosum (strain FD-172 SS1) TaxID=930990 RepID=A0A067M2F5_BOTB1|nr:hypothetical protein BOTBODRAFT_182255 [Botryobasidium botryosum FD-172 SS1]
MSCGKNSSSTSNKKGAASQLTTKSQDTRSHVYLKIKQACPPKTTTPAPKKKATAHTSDGNNDCAENGEDGSDNDNASSAKASSIDTLHKILSKEELEAHRVALSFKSIKWLNADSMPKTIGDIRTDKEFHTPPFFILLFTLSYSFDTEEIMQMLHEDVKLPSPKTLSHSLKEYKTAMDKNVHKFLEVHHIIYGYIICF